MPRRKKNLLPTRAGKCTYCNKDIYPDTIAASLGVEFFSQNPHRGAEEVKRYYRCPVKRGYHLTSEEKRGVEEMKDSA